MRDKHTKLLLGIITITIPNNNFVSLFVPTAVTKSAFTDKGFKVLNVYCPRKPDWRNLLTNENDGAEINDVKTRQNKFYVNLQKSPNVVEALKITQIGRHRVTVERANQSRELAQCFRCQDFGHTRNYCRKKPVCSKCSGDHETGSPSCELRLSELSICANCGENHISSFKGCTVRTELGRKLKPGARLPKQSNYIKPHLKHWSQAKPFEIWCKKSFSNE